MFGVSRKKQPKSVEEFFSGRDEPTGPVDDREEDDAAGEPTAKRRFATTIVVAVALVVLFFAVFLEIDVLKSDISKLRLQNRSELVDGLKTQVTALSAKVSESDRQAATLRAELGRLQKDLDAVKLMETKKPKTEVVARKPAPAKKQNAKPVKHRT